MHTILYPQQESVIDLTYNMNHERVQREAIVRRVEKRLMTFSAVSYSTVFVRTSILLLHIHITLLSVIVCYSSILYRAVRHRIGEEILKKN